MTTNFFDNTMCTSTFDCRGVSHEKQHFGRFSSLPPSPPPLKNRKFYFYCRLAVSEPASGLILPDIPSVVFSASFGLQRVSSTSTNWGLLTALFV